MGSIVEEGRGGDVRRRDDWIRCGWVEEVIGCGADGNNFVFVAILMSSGFILIPRRIHLSTSDLFSEKKKRSASCIWEWRA